MANSLSNLPTSAENCGRDEWIEILEASPPARLAHLCSKSDPLSECAFPGIELFCVLGFRAGQDSDALVYFWSQGLSAVTYDNLHKRERIKDFIRLAVMIGKVSKTEPSFQALKGLFDGQLTSLFAGDEDYLKDKHLYWTNYGDVRFTALFSTLPNKAFSAEAILNCLHFHHDYFRGRSPVWSGVPMTFLFDSVNHDADGVAKLLLEPKCFNPAKPMPQGWYLWPWQRSLDRAAGGEVQYRPIKTTSLVFDLRKSTLALEQLRDEDIGLFSGFLKEVVKAAKTAIFQQGGFFDKETGDGVVAHFADITLPDRDFEPASVRAFKAASALIKSVHAICEAFQDHLRMGVGGLGASVGLHSGKAVWICENNFISAIGESVIMAARLCAEAENLSIFVSNHEFQKLAKSLPPEDVSRFERRSYVGKEYNDRSKLFGYAMKP